MTETDLIEMARRYFDLSPDDSPTISMIETVWLTECPVKPISEMASRRAVGMLSYPPRAGF